MTVIDQVVARHPHLSGRDVKNLLKLTKLVSSSNSQSITLQTIDFVQQFRPTTGGRLD